MSSPETTRVVIIGAGDLGRSCLEILRACNERGGGYEVVGFLDDAPSCRDTQVAGLPVLGDSGWIESHRDDRFYGLIAIAGGGARQEIARRFPFLRFINAVHPTAVLASETRLGVGNVISAGVVIAHATDIGSHVVVNLNATVGHDCRVGDCVTIGPGANVAGHVRLGAGCDIGINATVIKGLAIGEWSALGPGSVALRDMAAGDAWFGNPARRFLRTEQLQRFQKRQMTA
jgi:sugar O-acyltransferase (sialic acid O-acetyltransferase NeuD family)